MKFYKWRGTFISLGLTLFAKLFNVSQSLISSIFTEFIEDQEKELHIEIKSKEWNRK